LYSTILKLVLEPSDKAYIEMKRLHAQENELLAMEAAIKTMRNCKL